MLNLIQDNKGFGIARDPRYGIVGCDCRYSTPETKPLLSVPIYIDTPGKHVSSVMQLDTSVWLAGKKKFRSRYTYPV